MAKLDLEFVGFENALDCIAIDGEIVKLKRTRKKTRICTLEMKNNNTEIVAYKTHYYTSKNWFWWNFLYYIVSFFGLFDIKQTKKCLVQDAKINISSENDANAIISRVNFTDGGKLLEVETQAKVEEISNIQYNDKDARKKHLKMKKIKTATTIAVAVLTVLLIVFL